VIETGALKNVAILTQSAAQSNVESIIAINSVEPAFIILESIIHHLIVSTTSQPAIKAQPASNITANNIAQPRVKALLQTAGHMLLATSFAHRLIAIYIAKIVAINKNILQCSTIFSFTKSNCVKYTNQIQDKTNTANNTYFNFEIISSLISITTFIFYNKLINLSSFFKGSTRRGMDYILFSLLILSEKLINVK
jgi:hypothetical protein